MKTRVPLRKVATWFVPVGLVFASAASSDTFTIEGHVIAVAAARSLNGPCYRLVATAGEPVAGYGAAAGNEIDAGFQATVRNDTLFFGSFEECAQ